MGAPSNSPSARLSASVPTSWAGTVLFLLLFSGPPKFRFRDPEASLSGEVDLAIMVAIAVWLAGGLWVAWQFWLIHSGKRPRLRLWLTHKLALGVIALLGVSIAVSLSPTVTAFKVYQILVEFLFVLIFIEWYGTERCLHLMFLACTVLSLAITAAVYLAPDIVLDVSETGFLRLRGIGIADTGIVTTFAIILLFTRTRPAWKHILPLSALFFGCLLFFSLARNAWLSTVVFFAVALWKRPAIKSLKWVYVFWTLAVLTFLAGAGRMLADLRNTESIYDLSNRLGLWAYFADVTLSKSPWLGLGYLAGTRELGMEYSPLLGAGHSIFFDVFVGGGILALTPFLALVLVLIGTVVKLLRRTSDAQSFAVCSLFIAVLIQGIVGADIDSSPSGFMFWSLVTMLPLLAEANLGNVSERIRSHRLSDSRRLSPS